MKRENLPLIIAVALPIIFIIILSLIIFVPSYKINPEYDFVYTQENRYYDYNRYYQNTLVVKDGMIVTEEIPTKADLEYTDENPPIFYYDVDQNTSRELTLEEAQSLTIDRGPSSPDGYLVEYVYENDGIFELFGNSSNDNGYHITQGTGKKRLSALSSEKYWDRGEFRFIGWVIN